MDLGARATEDSLCIDRPHCGYHYELRLLALCSIFGGVWIANAQSSPSAQAHLRKVIDLTFDEDHEKAYVS